MKQIKNKQQTEEEYNEHFASCVMHELNKVFMENEFPVRFDFQPPDGSCPTWLHTREYVLNNLGRMRMVGSFEEGNVYKRRFKNKDSLWNNHFHFIGTLEEFKSLIPEEIRNTLDIVIVEKTKEEMAEYIAKEAYKMRMEYPFVHNPLPNRIARQERKKRKKEKEKIAKRIPFGLVLKHKYNYFNFIAKLNVYYIRIKLINKSYQRIYTLVVRNNLIKSFKVRYQNQITVYKHPPYYPNCPG